MTKLTAKQEILLSVIDWVSNYRGEDLTPQEGESPEDAYDRLMDEGYEDELYDAMNEFRASGEDTDIKCDVWSRHYECKQVARELPSGKAVSWPYWYGGGKHSEPQAIEWIDDAFFVDVKTETKIVKVFTKSEA